MAGTDTSGGDSGLGAIIDGATAGGAGLIGAGNGGTTPGSAAASGVSSLLPNIQAWFDEWIAKSANSLNQILNTAWYGWIAVFGIAGMAYGIYLLAKDLPGTGQGAADILGFGKLAEKPVMGAAKVAGAVADPAAAAAATVSKKMFGASGLYNIKKGSGGGSTRKAVGSGAPKTAKLGPAPKIAAGKRVS